MSRQTYENQSMLVVIGVGGISYGIIAATASDVIKHEVKEVSGNVEDHFGDESPTEFGLYVWEGTLTVELGGWVGEAEVDPDTEWDGKFRQATHADLVEFGFLDAAPASVLGAPSFETWWTLKAIEVKGRPFMSRREAAQEAWVAAQAAVPRAQAVAAKEDTGRSAKRPDAIPTADVPELRLQCYHLSVHTALGNLPGDRITGHSGHNSIELVDPAPGTSQLLQAWANEDWEKDDELVLRHVIIEDRHGERRFLAQRWGKTMVNLGGSITFQSYTDYAAVLPNPGVEEMMVEFDREQAA